MSKELRGTGRTTRMMEAAVKQAKNGDSCFVVFAKQQQIQEWKNWLLNNYVKDDVLSDKVFVGSKGGSIQFILASHPTVDLKTCQILGASRKSKVFIDHFAIEYFFDRLLYELNRFNQQKASSGESEDR